MSRSSSLPGSIVRTAYRAAAAGLDLVGLKAAVRTHVLPRLLAAAQGSAEAPMTDTTAAMIDAEIRRNLAEPGRLFVGPWTSEVGFELIYWLPFLAWLRERYDVPAERLVAVTRGGAGVWYGDIVGETAELFDLVDPETFRARSAERWRDVGGQKQIFLDEWESDLLARLRARGVEAGQGVLHPYLMYALFWAVWQGKAPASLVDKYSRYAALPRPPDQALELRDDFVAMRFYFRPSFPDTLDNRRLIAGLVERITSKRPVVLLNPRLEIDDHSDWLPAGGEGVLDLGAAMTPSNNLAVQSAAIAQSRAFIGTYGGLSYLAPLYGKPSLAISTAPEHNLPVHQQIADCAAEVAGGRLLVIGRRDLALFADLGLFDQHSGPSETGLNVASLEGW
ncbi:MAG: hypothetical protein MI753_01140 [Hyphomicrobiales bacterium]|nr:hypothetical protein [Hyphomicrobiales bacterium]